MECEHGRHGAGHKRLLMSGRFFEVCVTNSIDWLSRGRAAVQLADGQTVVATKRQNGQGNNCIRGKIMFVVQAA